MLIDLFVTKWWSYSTKGKDKAQLKKSIWVCKSRDITSHNDEFISQLRTPYTEKF